MTDTAAQRAPKPGVLVRCKGPRCPVSGGQILFRVHRGVVYVEVRLRAGESVRVAVYGMPISATCPACDCPWINPDAIASDGVGGVIERAIADIAARVDEQATNEQQSARRRLRPTAA